MITAHDKTTLLKLASPDQSAAAERSLLRALIDNLPDYIFVKDTQSRFVLNNKAHLQVLGATTPDQVSGKTDFDIFPSELAAQYYADEQRIIQTGQPLINHEEITLTPQGKRQWLLTTKVPLRDRQEQIIGLVGVSRDITERKHMEEVLQASEVRNRALIEAIPDAILRISQDGALLDVKLGEYPSIGSETDLVGKRLAEILPPQVAQQELAEIQRALETGQVQTSEYQIPIAGTIYSREARMVALGRHEVIAIVRDITERTRIEKALRASEAFNRAVLDSLTAHVAVLDKEGAIVAINKAWENFGRENGADPARTGVRVNYLDVCRRVIINEEASYAEEALLGIQAVLTGSLNNFSLEYPCHSPTRKRWFVLYATPLPKERGGAVVSHINITKRKWAEEALQASQQLVHHINEAAPFIIYIHNVIQQRNLYVNNQVSVILGYAPAEMQNLGTRLFELLVYPDDYPGLVAHFKRLASDTIGDVFEYEYRIKHADGTWRWLRSRDVVFTRNAYGLPEQILGTAEDITKHKRAEEILRESEKKYRELVENTNNIIIRLDSQGRITFANEFAQKFFGYTAAEIVGQPTIGTIVPEINSEGQDLRRLVEDIAQSPEAYNYHENENVRRNGERVWIAWTNRAIKDESGNLIEVFSIGSDITERKRAEEEKNRLLEAISRQRQQLHALTGQLAETQEIERKQLARELHDRVGQNLTALGLNLNLIGAHLSETTPGAGAVQVRLNDSLALVEQTTQCIRDVMADLRPPVLDDYGLLAALRWYGGRVAARAGFTITIKGEEPFPRLDTPIENALFRIAQEALTNVAKHAQATHVILKVELDNGIVRLIVSDNGHGFDLACLTLPTERPSWGVLTMTERAEAIGGWFQIESDPGQGTQVVVEVSR